MIKIIRVDEGMFIILIYWKPNTIKNSSFKNQILSNWHDSILLLFITIFSLGWIFLTTNMLTQRSSLRTSGWKMSVTRETKQSLNFSVTWHCVTLLWLRKNKLMIATTGYQQMEHRKIKLVSIMLMFILSLVYIKSLIGNFCWSFCWSFYFLSHLKM